MELLVVEAAMATVDDPRTAMELQDWARVKGRDRDKVDSVASPRIPMELLAAEAVVVPRVATVLLARVKDKDKAAALAANPRTRMVLLVVAMAMATEDVHRAAMELLARDKATEMAVVLRAAMVPLVAATAVVPRTPMVLQEAVMVMADVPRTLMALLVVVTEMAAATAVVHPAVTELLVRVKVDLADALRTLTVLLVRTRSPRTPMEPQVMAMAMATADVLRAAMELQDPDQDLVADPPTPTDPPPRDLELVALEAVDPVALTTKTM